MYKNAKGMKKSLFLLLGLLTSVSMLAEVFDYEYKGLTYEYDIDTQKATLTFGGIIDEGGNHNKITNWTVDVPEYIEVGDNKKQYKVTCIGENAFKDNSSVNYIIIPDYVNTIEKGAFQSMSNLRLVKLPKNIVTIDNSAFQNCNNLAHVWCDNPNPLTIPAENLFRNECMTLYVPEGSIGNFDEHWKKVFGDRIYEGEMVIRKSPDEKRTYVCAKPLTKSVGKATLFEWDNGEDEKEIRISDSFNYGEGNVNVKYDVINIGIGSKVFKTPKSVNVLIIDDGIETISNSAFDDCQGLQRITLPSNLKYIGTNAFRSCNNLFHICCNVVDPATLNGYSARFPQNEMMTLYVPENSYKNASYSWNELFKERIYTGGMDVENVDNMTFIVATGSKEATLSEVSDKTVEISSISAPEGYSLTGIDPKAFSDCKKIISMDIPEHVTHIGPNAFQSCSLLETIKLPSSLKRIGSNAFSGCGNLICVENRATSPIKISSNLFSMNNYEKTLYAPDGSLSSYQYGRDEYEGWSKFTYYMGGQMKLAHWESENGVIKMDYIYSTESHEATLINVETSEEEIQIPNQIEVEGGNHYADVTLIRKNAFKPVTSTLKRLAFENGNKGLAIGEKALSGCSNLRLLRLPERLKRIGEQAFYDCSRLREIELKSLPCNISSNVFRDETKNKGTLYVPNGNFGSYDYDGKGWNFAIIECDQMEEFVDKDNNNMTFVGWGNTGQTGNAKLTIGANPAVGSTLTIPTEAKGNNSNYSVIAIAESAFSGKSFEKLIIPEGITTIGVSAFQNNQKLLEIDLPSSLTSIGENAFAQCENINVITSRKAVPFEITNVFSAKITPTVYIPNSSKKSDYEDVKGWDQFAGMYVPGEIFEGAPSDKPEMIYKCNTAEGTATLIRVNTTSDFKLQIPSIVSVKKEDGTVVDNLRVTKIGNYVIKYNDNRTQIETIEILADVISIGDYAFQGCSKLTEVKLPEDSNLETIGDYAFQGCGSLKSIDLSKLKKIGVSAFSGTKITELRLDSVETIGAGAFQNCNSLTKVWLPSTLTSIGDNAFAGCNSITHVDSRSLSPSLGDGVFSLADGNTSTLFVPNGGTVNYNSLSFSNIVEGEYVGDKSDNDMTYSCYLVKDADGNVLRREAILTNADRSIRLASIRDSIGRSEEGSEGQLYYYVTSIGKYAFKNSKDLAKLELPAHLTSIGYKAFADCVGIKEIVSDVDRKDDMFPVTDVFSGDIHETALIYVPEGCKSYYQKTNGWLDFKNYDEGKLLQTEPPKDYLKYRYHTGLKTATVIEIVTPDYLTDLSIPGTVEIEGKPYTVENIAPSVVFPNKGKITSLTIGRGVKDIGENAFKGSSNLATVSLPTTLTNIGDYAFNGTKITELHLDSVKTIGDYAFQGCSSLAKLELSPSLKKIGVSAFSGTKITELRLDCVETIGAGAFQNCNSLTKVWLPSTLTSIGDNAFAGSNLIRVCTESFAIIENADAFSTYGKAILFVPTGALATINEKAGWRDFTRKYEGYYEGESPESVERSYIYLKQADESRNAILTKSTTSDPIKTAVAYDNKDYIVNIIGENAFGGVNLEEWTSLPEGIVAVDKNAFKNSRLQELTLPSSLKTIGDGAFSGNGLKKIELPSTLTRIAENAFDGCNNLTEVFSRITDKKVIADNSLSVPHAILYVNEGYADEYAGWNFLHILDGEKVLGSYAGVDYIYTVASKKAILVSVPKDAIKDGAVIIPPAIPLGKDHVVCDVISIDKDAFSDIKSDVKTVTIGENVKTIGTGLFQSCSNLTDIICNNIDNDFILNNVISLPQATLYVPEHADWYKNAGWTFAHYYEGERKEEAQDGLVYAYTKGSNEAILVKVAENADWPNGKVAIPSSITIEDVDYHVISIANSVFKDNTKVKTVEIGANIQSIGANAFQNCRNLKEVVSKITDPEVIGSIAFSKSDAILYIPNDGLFEAYSSSWKFAQVYAGERYEVENEGLAYVCVKTSTDKRATLVGLGAQGAGIKNGILDIPVSIPVTNEGNFDVVAIADNAFSGVNDIEYINVRSKALLESSTLNKNVFSRYVATLYVPHVALESYVLCDVWKTFPVKKEGYLKGVKSQDGLKYECLINGENKYVASLIKSENLGKVDIPTSVKLDGADDAYVVTSIYKEAFKGCNGLKVVWLSATLESIDKTAFSGCNGIAYVSSAIDNPTAADANIFPSSATLFVPQGRKSNYNIGGWNNFAYVGEGRFVDAATASDMSFDCYTDNAGTKKAILKKYNVNAATVEIPGSVKVGNDAYTVSIITKQAFASKTNMESLIIPSGVETIEAEAFNACSKLKWIESKIVNPISISNVFANTNATLFIPSTNVSDYKARGWNFLNVFVGERKQTDVDGWTYVYSTGDKKAVLTRVGNVGTNVTINGTFKIGKDEYTVTSVGDAVFKGKSNIEALTIAKSIENIGANAFEGCVKLVSITCEGSSPAKLGADAFPSANVTVNVPNDAVNTYKNHPDWKPFANNILGITTSVEDDPTGAYNIIVPAGGDATPEVEIWSGLDASGDVVIPEVVELNGSDYKVTGIAANAYDSNTDLTSIVIPSSITSIGASAFAGCTNLKSITVYCVTPINLSAVAATRRALTRAGGSSSVFEGVNKETCILYVPAESIDAYKQAEGWKDFKKIYAIGTNAINGIVVSEGKPFDVYNLQGRKVKANTTTFSGLPAGVYIVNGKKVMVK